MTKDEALKHAPEGSTHYTPNGNMFVRVGKSGFVEVCRSGGVVMKEYLSEATLITGALEYRQDEDGNIAIYQNDQYIVMTPKQQQDVVSLLQASLDIVSLNWSKR